MIEVRNLTKEFNNMERKALDNVSFEVNEGELVGLIGLNGAGKSTLLKSICKFLRPTSGEIFIDGINIWDKDECLKDVGILLEPVFFEQMTAVQNMKFMLEIHNKNVDDMIINDVLDLVGLKKAKDKKPSTFSFGMKQRLGLAMALIGEPKILILDEPFIGLDPTGISDLIGVLKGLIIKKHMCAIISSHQLYELSEVCERVMVINEGKIVFDGIPEVNQQKTMELIKNNRSPLEQFFE